ncbi:hypothetical protein Ddc_06928 [Ditylenchus destructor]|nr:hypothetical protein Ddc_06928 [Ditylenchus destructor]
MVLDKERIVYVKLSLDNIYLYHHFHAVVPGPDGFDKAFKFRYAEGDTIRKFVKQAMTHVEMSSPDEWELAGDYASYYDKRIQYSKKITLDAMAERGARYQVNVKKKAAKRISIDAITQTDEQIKADAKEEQTLLDTELMSTKSESTCQEQSDKEPSFFAKIKNMVRIKAK